ncbi:MAG: hypothetical protein ACXABY_37720 [Candidatus Thorarchaeota archaeon]|jgi:hypothetical protein
MEQTYWTVHCKDCGEPIESEMVDVSDSLRELRVDASHKCNGVLPKYEGMTLPINYEKELKEAREKLQHHEERVSYHGASAQAMRELITDLEPGTFY